MTIDRVLLDDAPFLDVTGKPILVSDEGPEMEATVKTILLISLKLYDQDHRLFAARGQILSNGEVEAYNRILEVLTNPGGICFDIPDFAVLKKVVNWVLPLSPWWRSGPELNQILDNATTIKAV